MRSKKDGRKGYPSCGQILFAEDSSNSPLLFLIRFWILAKDALRDRSSPGRYIMSCIWSAVSFLAPSYVIERAVKIEYGDMKAFSPLSDSFRYISIPKRFNAPDMSRTPCCVAPVSLSPIPSQGFSSPGSMISFSVHPERGITSSMKAIEAAQRRRSLPLVMNGSIPIAI